MCRAAITHAMAVTLAEIPPLSSDNLASFRADLNALFTFKKQPFHGRYFNPGENGVIRGGWKFRVNDKVMQVKNN
ncbi:hypothetical protein KA005_55835 [bacterium]|nr:hypothetical protein [bacterium]